MGRCGLVEKEVTLDIAKRLKQKLEQECFNVYLTRSGDKFIPLAKRTQIANSYNADFFISIHVNAARIKNAKGFEVYYLSEAADDAAKHLAEEENASLKMEEASYKVNSPNNLEGILWDLVSTENRAESIQLAGWISRAAKKDLWVNQRGVKSAGFYVLKGARMPAILVEVGFITNKDEEEKLKDPNYRDKIADSIAKGILTYREEYQQAEGFTK
jgi:N-acetylmuramoyl-L-alanine amidase